MVFHSPFLLDTDRDKPNSENDVCKFWNIDKTDGLLIVLALNKKTQDKTYLLTDGKRWITENKSLESVCVERDIIRFHKTIKE